MVVRFLSSIFSYSSAAFTSDEEAEEEQRHRSRERDGRVDRQTDTVDGRAERGKDDIAAAHHGHEHGGQQRDVEEAAATGKVNGDGPQREH